MFCPRCGTENEVGSKYCASCGASLARREKAAGQDLPGTGTLGERVEALIGRDRRTKVLTLLTIAAVLIAVLAFLALDSSDGVDVPQDAYTRALDRSCIQRKGEIAAAQRKALGGGGLPAVSRYADAVVTIVGEWRLELGRAPVPPDRSDLVDALQAALLEAEIEAGALARVARESDRGKVARVATRVDAGTANVEAAVHSLGLERCGELVVSQGQLVGR